MKTLKIDKTWTLFLDRDGVINKRLVGDYVKKVEEFEFLPGVPQAIAEFNSMFSKVFVVTNQQGIGKGLMTHEDLESVHMHLQNEIAAQNAHIDAFYYCPKLASESPNCRKPNPAMGHWAKTDFPDIDFSKSIMVGDSVSDMEFGRNLGMVTVFVSEEKKENNFTDFYTTSLADLASLVER